MMPMVLPVPSRRPDVSTNAARRCPKQHTETPAGSNPARTKKRVITEARKEQNRAAQQKYRQRQRERRQRQQEDPVDSRPRRLPQLAPASTQGATGEDSNRARLQGKLPLEPIDPERDEADVPSTQSGIGIDGFADLYMNTLQFVQTTIFSAILHNALALGFSLSELAECGVEAGSPFYCSADRAHTDPVSLMASCSESFPSINLDSAPASLRPTVAQFLIPHHSSLDLIPLPLFRERAIMLSVIYPKSFNLWELKLDIYARGGLMVWRHDRVANRDIHGRGCLSCQPWDSESWEAAPWFLEKWSLAMGAGIEPLEGQSLQWQALRRSQACLKHSPQSSGSRAGKLSDHWV